MSRGAVGTLDMSGIDKGQRYYTLCPLTGDGRVYVPVDTRLSMRPAMDREAALALIKEVPQIDAECCRLSNKRVLEEHYREMMRPHTPAALVRTIRSVYKKRDGGDRPRVLSSTDEYYRKRAEALLFQELGYALGISAEEAAERIDLGSGH